MNISNQNESNLFLSTYSLLLKIYLLEIDNNAKFGEINFTDDTFLVDFLINKDIGAKDFKSIEKKIIKLALNLEKYEIINLTKAEALKKVNYDEFTSELIKESNLSNFRFIHLLKKDLFIWHEFPILDKFSDLKFNQLLSIGGVYWKANENKPQLIRIVGCSFKSENELTNFVKEFEERKERDHRKIGKNLELFTFNSLTGQGMPIWLPYGTTLRNIIGNYVHDCQLKYGFNFVSTPVLGNLELYKISGHYSHYNEDMFPPIELDNESMMLRPMTCPHHCLVYLNKPHSYKELPIRLSEDSIMHRYESSGSLIGLERVRVMTLLDNHIFCRPDQIEDEIINAYNIINEVIKTFNLKIDHIDLALHDPENKTKFIDDNEMWNRSETQLENALKKFNVSFSKKIGDAAFYGPKIDFQCKTSLNKIITCSTIQLDFSLPQKFNTTYIDSQNNQSRCVIIHLGIIGTYERFIATLLEQTKGILPIWLAPVQVKIIPVNNQVHLESCKTLLNKLLFNKIRCEIDSRDERLSKKIRDAQIQKIPLQIVIGDNEAKNLEEINYRQYGSELISKISFLEFVKMIENANIEHK
ncbi:threonine--tRNA ligase [Mycoplasmoides pirum]|uniref:threonine--tRNA ligase n=1 Tax=Mycoplasmoides pirum TaxID=2122 RepID=UPI000696D3A7|nr:threonine--tRNA ligase [Mycoplasmoides pirum]